MKNRIIKVIESHLEDSLRLELSIDEELIEQQNLIASMGENYLGKENTDNSISSFWGNLLGVVALSFLVIIQLLFLPILIWPNLYRLYLRVVYKIPFQVFMCPGPCREIDRIDNKIKIEIRSNDHLPPHFHVRIDDDEASFTINDCTLLNGNLKNKYIKTIIRWHEDNKKVLVKEWNITRPTGREKDFII